MQSLRPRYTILTAPDAPEPADELRFGDVIGTLGERVTLTISTADDQTATDPTAPGSSVDAGEGSSDTHGAPSLPLAEIPAP